MSDTPLAAGESADIILQPSREHVIGVTGVFDGETVSLIQAPGTTHETTVYQFTEPEDKVYIPRRKDVRLSVSDGGGTPSIYWEVFPMAGR
jgi:hypothetical protein